MDSQKKKTQEKKIKRPKKITRNYLHNSGLYYLQRFTASSGHFKFVMMTKIRKSIAFHKEPALEECEKILDEIITEFTELGHINDHAYCRGMVNSMRRRGLSRRAIMQKLAQKKLPSEMISTALDEVDAHQTAPDLTAALLHAKKKRLGPFAIDKDYSDEKIKNRALGSLARAGYGFDISIKILEMPHEEALDILYQSRY